VASTISDNTAGGGVFAFGGTSTLEATIVSGNTGSTACTGTITDIGWNIDDDGTCGFTAGESISHSDTLDGTLGPLANNGGPTQTILPTLNSPAVGVIQSSIFTINVCPGTDQRGFLRPPLGEGTCSMGAVEPTGPPTITGFSPTSGSVGTTVTITGTNLTDASGVTFNGATATILKDTSTKVKVRVPNGATTGKIKVVVAGGKAKSSTSFAVT
jgi:hypothetical protein